MFFNKQLKLSNLKQLYNRLPVLSLATFMCLYMNTVEILPVLDVLGYYRSLTASSSHAAAYLSYREKNKHWHVHSFLLSLLVFWQILGYADYAFTSIFTVEILLKVRLPQVRHRAPSRLRSRGWTSAVSDDGPRSVPPPGLLLQELV